jgi:hypothetical protein
VSTGYDAVCDVCRISVHAGQRSGGSFYTFGYGSGDQSGRDAVAKFCFEHAYCGDGGVRIVLSDTTEHRECDDYQHIEEYAWLPELP